MHETLQLVRSRYGEKETDRLVDRLRDARRALGAVRDADTADELLQHLDARLPVARGLVAELRARFRDDRLRARRRLIKRLETLDLEQLPRQLYPPRRMRSRLMPAGDWSWRQSLREHVSARAIGARDAVEHATEVYFPNRAHAARIALKKLRYAIELASATGLWPAPRGARKLPEVQDALGGAHDREVLKNRVQHIATAPPEWPAAEANALVRFLTDETLRLHDDYLARRDDILGVVSAAEEIGHPNQRRALWAAAAVAVPSAWLIRKASKEDDRVRVFVRTSIVEPFEVP